MVGTASGFVVDVELEVEVDFAAEFDEFAKTRLCDDPHLWATALFDEVVALGYEGSYPSFTRRLRAD
jgi:hypothetical protein